VRRAIRAAGARLFYLQKYSPDLNPIEQLHRLRKAARRTTEDVYNAIGPILDTVSAAQCANYFANAGYDQT
jgi:transposase